MNKYLTVYSTSFKQESKTISNSMLSVVSFAVIIYIFNELWRYIYGNGGIDNVINGYTIEMMIWYLIMAEIIAYAVNPRSVTREISNDIKSGKIAYQLNKPYNYFGYQIANQAGVSCWKLCFLLPAGFVMGVVLLGGIASYSIIYLLPTMVSLMFAIILTCTTFSTVGLLSFWVEESSPFSWIIQKFVMLFGLFFPPEFFPTWIGNIITYSPIYAMMSGPCKLLANFSWPLFIEVILLQIGYTILIFCIGQYTYKKGTKKVNVNGG